MGTQAYRKGGQKSNKTFILETPVRIGLYTDVYYALTLIYFSYKELGI